MLGHRLRHLGIEPRQARNGALLCLAEHLPSRILADLLGLHIVTAERWSAAAGTRWMGWRSTSFRAPVWPRLHTDRETASGLRKPSRRSDLVSPSAVDFFAYPLQIGQRRTR